MSDKIYKIVTDQIVALLEKGVCPWRKPWNPQTGEAKNLVSKKPYHGVNVFILCSLPYSSPYWVTYNQAKKLGGHVRKGEKGTAIVFWKFFDVEDKETGEKKTIPLLRYYTVFNVEQCEGFDDKIPQTTGTKEPVAVSSVAAGYIDREENLTLCHGGSRACYRASDDTVIVPNSGDFDSEEDYHDTLFHELVHSTGHKSRLNRFDNPDQFQFASDSYSKEELIAEMGAAFLCHACGISQDTDNSAAYIGSWLRTLKQPKNVRLIVSAAGKAQKAADMILGN